MARLRLPPAMEGQVRSDPTALLGLSGPIGFIPQGTGTALRAAEQLSRFLRGVTKGLPKKTREALSVVDVFSLPRHLAQRAEANIALKSIKAPELPEFLGAHEAAHIIGGAGRRRGVDPLFDLLRTRFEAAAQRAGPPPPILRRGLTADAYPYRAGSEPFADLLAQTATGQSRRALGGIFPFPEEAFRAELMEELAQPQIMRIMDRLLRRHTPQSLPFLGM